MSCYYYSWTPSAMYSIICIKIQGGSMYGDHSNNPVHQTWSGGSGECGLLLVPSLYWTLQVVLHTTCSRSMSRFRRLGQKSNVNWPINQTHQISILQILQNKKIQTMHKGEDMSTWCTSHLHVIPVHNGGRGESMVPPHTR